mgnify:CR=1 FL=1
MNNMENLYRQVIMDHYKNPRNKGARGANRDDLPKSTFFKRSQAQTIRQIRRRDVDSPDIPCVAKRCTVENQRCSRYGKEQGRNSEESDIERAYPEIEKISSEERAAPDAILLFKAHHRHCILLPSER